MVDINRTQNVEEKRMTGIKPIACSVLLLLIAAMGGNAAEARKPFDGAQDRPNVIVILADDLGYADLGCQGSRDVKAPHIDSLAANGVRCTAGYVTAPQCGPSRAGLLTGRYQNRFGFESNEQAYRPGIPLDQPLISERMKAAGYATGMFGKWGVTNYREGHPPQRGFDESFWNHDGNRYFPDTPSKYDVKMRRGNQDVELKEYSTDAFGREAVAFIHRHANEPFFIYLPFVTPHEPNEAKPEDLARFADVEDKGRRTFLAMMACLDDNVGRILGALREEKLEEDTLIVFLSDNGGYPGISSRNDPFWGTKSSMAEGGIRIPFIVQWKGHLPAGKVYEQPVISLDILPTALGAAGVEINPSWKLDGVDLLPYLSGRSDDAPHEALYWRFCFPRDKPNRHGWAIRKGDWKLMRGSSNDRPIPPALYNLEDDPREGMIPGNDLIKKHPEIAQALRAEWEKWDAGNQAPARYEWPARRKENKAERRPATSMATGGVNLPVEGAMATHLYGFDGNVTDSVGGAHGTPTAVGTCIEAPRFTTDIPAAAVEGSPTRSLEVGMTASKKSGFLLGDVLNSSAGSASVWFKPDTLTGGNYILVTQGFKLMAPTETRLRAVYNEWTLLGETTVSTGTWNHATLTWDASTSTMSYYVNGASVVSKSDATVADMSANGVRVGSFNLHDSTNHLANQFDGKIYDLRFYDSALTRAQVASLYANPGGEVKDAPIDRVTLCPHVSGAQCKAVTVAGRSAWQSEKAEKATGSRTFYFDIQDPLLKNGNAQSVTITLTHLDRYSAPLFLQYDSSDKSIQHADGAGVWKRADGVTTGESGEWKTVSWTLKDALFRSRCHAHDFRVTIGADVDFVIAGCTVAGTAKQTLIMPDVFSGDMILQRGVPVPVWGQAEDGTVVTVSFDGYDLESTARDGKWRVVFPPMKASKTPRTMAVSASNGYQRTFGNVLVGDVWLASGQSNMEMMLSEAKGGKEAIAASRNPMLRLFKVPRCLENTVAPVGTTWKESNPQSAPPQSAVGYFFVRELQKKLDIPVGLLNCSYGGTVTETWCSPEVMARGWPDWEATEKRYLQNPAHPRRNTSSHLHNRMLKTVMPFPVKGFIWYQGEGNAWRAEEQKRLFPAMVRNWRRSWGNDELPFYIVQLARYEAADWHAFRCAQLDVWKNTPDTYMACTIDLSKEPGNHPIHPKTKAPIGHRLALAARANVYGEEELVYSGPVIRSMKVEGSVAVLAFGHLGSGLIASDNQPLRGFYISADGESFSAAEARIKGETVIVSSSTVPNPVAVRYGAEADMGKKELDVNLANREGLPASPFTVRARPTHRQAQGLPNIIFFLADDLGYGDLGCYNRGTDIQSPVLDGLAKDGVRFTDHYATAPLCSPSRRAFLTGRWQSRLGEWAEPYPGTPNMDGIPADKEPTVAMFLKQAGYATGCFGKWNIGGVDGVSRPGAHGYDEYLCVDHNTDYFYHRKYSHKTRLFDDGCGLYTRGGEVVDLGGKYLPDVFGDAAIAFIEEHKDRPFFIYLPWCVPHTPMQGPDDIKDTRDNPVPKNIKGQHSRETFVEMAEYMDAKTGQILEALKKHGLADNTLIMFSSDNGGQVLGNCEPLRGHKHTLFEGGIRVPMIAHWPGGFRGRKVIEQPTVMMDVTATILDVAGARATRELDGTSLLPWINGTRKPEDRLFGWRQRIIDYGHKHNYLRAEACRYGNLKYLKETHAKGTTPSEFPFTEYLFDLSKDLGERNNLVQSNPELLGLMRRKYAEWRKNVVNVETPVYVNAFPDQYGHPTPEQIKRINDRYFRRGVTEKREAK